MKTITPRSRAEAGISRRALYSGARDGRLERIARGIYLPSNAPTADWDWLEAATRRADATLCLISALSYHDLTDEIPATLDVAIPRGSRIPAGKSAITWHSFDRATFELGRTKIQIPGMDLTIGLYSPERTIADVFRMRGEVSYEIARDALRQWLKRGGKPGSLIQTARRLPRALGPILRTLEGMQ